MPDPAVDAARLGLPYTEPRGHGLNARLKSKAKITFEHDPNNPYAPPKRIIEKMGFWERVIGPKSDTVRSPSPPFSLLLLVRLIN